MHCCFLSWIGRSEDDFINDLFLQDIRQRVPGPFEELPDHRSITGVLNSGIKGVPDEVEKGLQAGISGSRDGLFLPLGDLVKKPENLVWGQRSQVPVAELAIEPGQDELMGANAIFFSSSPRGTQNNTSPLLTLS